MIRIFTRDGKINIVDDQNVFVGYDIIQDCCEDFRWVISEEPDPLTADYNAGVPLELLDKMRFDTTFFKQTPPPENSACYDTSTATFRLVGPSSDGDEAWLHLYNSHNGYYGHGFTATIGGQPWQDGVL